MEFLQISYLINDDVVRVAMSFILDYFRTSDTNQYVFSINTTNNRSLNQSLWEPKS